MSKTQISDKIKHISLDKIQVFIDRKRETKGHQQLTESIKHYGLLIPISVVKLSGGGYKLVKGQGRLLAHQKLGLSTIKAFVFEEEELPDKEIVKSWLIENEVRDSLSKVDKARLMKVEFDRNSSYEKTAKLFLTTSSRVKQYIKMLERTSEKVIEMVDDKKISFTQAKELSATVKTKTAQESTADLIVRNKLSQKASRVVMKNAREMEQKGTKVTIQKLEKRLSAQRSEIVDRKTYLNALENRYNQIVPIVKGLMNDPDFLALIKKHNLPVPETKKGGIHVY